VKSAVGGRETMAAEVHPRLKEHKEYFEKHVGELARAAEASVTKYRKAIVERQFVLERLANMAIDLYATACTIARTQQLVEERGVEACARELALCDLFCVEAGRRFRANRLAVDAREEDVDDRRRAVATAAREGTGYFVTDAILTDTAAEAAPGARAAAPSGEADESDTAAVGRDQVGAA
jgi:hypothetical protein